MSRLRRSRRPARLGVEGLESRVTPATLFVDDLTASPGQTVPVAINIQVTEPTGITVDSAEYYLDYDTTNINVSNPRLGTATPASAFSLTPSVDDATGNLAFLLSSGTGGVTLANG